MAKEKRLILKHLDSKGYNPSITCYLKHNGYKTLKKAFSLLPLKTEDGKTLSAQEQLREFKRLKKALELEKIRGEAYSHMIDLAEKQFNIPIRKTSVSKKPP